MLISDPDTTDTAIISAIKTLIEIAPEEGIERLLEIYSDGVGKNKVAVIKFIHSILPEETNKIEWEDDSFE